MEPNNLILDNYSCPNRECPSYGLKGLGNIGYRGTYGKENKPLLYCRTCKKRFAATVGTAFYGSHLPVEVIKSIVHHAAEGVGVRATARLLDMDKDTVNDVILKVGTHCAVVLDGLLRSLDFPEVQMDELWSFIKKKNVMSLLPRKRMMMKKKAKSQTTTTS
ncbi:MAG: hypothetical protein LBO05_11755 [Deltaproteobacteria bacterium]|jgi:transposase-like protein|nr:hypothetical protein [Deltaproteobacteria bacterium]